MAEPARIQQTFPSVILHPVVFEGRKLWQARYPSLIDYDHAPKGLQIEPAFQVFAELLEVVFQIAEGQDAVFHALGDAVSFQHLTPAAQPVAEVSVTLVDGNPRACRVVWNRTPGARITALRIVCRHEAGEPSSEDDGVARTVVEGGVYLVILDGGEARAFPEPAQRQGYQGQPGRVQVVDINEANSQPVFDLFHAEFSHLASIAPEPAFRVAHGESIEFPLALDLPPEYQDVRFKVDAEGQVAMSYAVPGWKPEELKSSRAGEDGRLCTWQWSRPGQASCALDPTAQGCTQGRTANLYAQLDPGPLRGRLGDAFALVNVDPTVIDPPACDASGVCTKPRDRDGS